MCICAAVNCSNKSNKAKNIVLYRLPKDKTIQKQWLANLKRENIPIEVRVCSMHFEESCFNKDILITTKINDHLNEEQVLVASNPPSRFSFVKMRLSITENAKNLNKN